MCLCVQVSKRGKKEREKGHVDLFLFIGTEMHCLCQINQ